MKKIITVILLFFVLLGTAFASSPKREMRATWIASVWQIDWPKSYVTTTGNQTQINSQKQRFITLLDAVEAANVNTVFLQVRSRADAMYQSDYEPWSSDLVDVRGKDPGYDPLAFAIEEAHKRGIQLYAWVNPYRFESVSNAWAGKAGNYRDEHPDWVLDINGAAILDPGNPDVRMQIRKIIGNIVNKYDVDGVVFDDYFYLSGITNEDKTSQDKYKPESMSVGDWRRGNVNQLISEIQDTIKAVKPHVMFGVGPAGNWSSKQTNADKYGLKLPPGVTTSYNPYDALYCDALAWMKAKTVDFVSPQIYWATTHATAPFEPLCQWWSDVASLFNTQLYVSLNLSDITNIPTSATNPTGFDLPASIKRNTETIRRSGATLQEYLSLISLENNEREKDNSKLKAIPAVDFLTQIGLTRTYDKNNAQGSVFYSTTPLTNANTQRMFVNNVFQNKSLAPAMWRSYSDQSLPTNLRVEGTDLKWDYTSNEVRYVVYAIPNGSVNDIGNFAKSDYIVGVSYSKSFELLSSKPTTEYTYAVSVLDRFGNEFSPAVYGKAISTGETVVLTSPLNSSTAIHPFKFTWQSQSGVEYYIFEMSDNETFSSVIYRGEVTTPEYSSNDLDFLDGNEYYWRVKSVKASSAIGTSAIWKFKAGILELTYPQNNATGISTTPIIKWSPEGYSNTYTVEISSNLAFSSIIHTAQVSNAETYQMPANILTYNSNYYARIRTTKDGVESISSTVYFSTEESIPSVPVITFPANNADVEGDNITVKWQPSTNASGFRVELHTNESFSPPRDIKASAVGAFVYETNIAGLTTDKDYYLRVRANYEPSLYTAWSDIIKVTLKPNVSIGTNDLNKYEYYIKTVDGSDRLSISTSEPVKVFVSLYNTSGIRVLDIAKNIEVPGSEMEFVLPDYLSSGLYFIVITTEKGTNSLKWVH